MAAFPKSPVPPAELLERWLPKAFAEAELPDEMRASDLRLGVCLTGKGGGEWVLELEGGELRVRPTSRGDTAFSYVQSVADWLGALWEGRGGLVGQATAGLFRPGEMPVAGGASGAAGMVALPSPAAIEQMRALDGLVRVLVTDGQGGDWSVGFKLGPGPIPALPTTTVAVAEADVAAMQRGELNPLEAFMAGRIRVDGDMTLVMQMQAIAMQAAAQAKKA
jgi:hypothetical protein